MPTNNGDITFKYGSQNAYNALTTTDTNAVYVTTDTHRIYIDGVDYTADTEMNNVTKQYVDGQVGIIGERIDNIITHNNDTEGNTELIDIRTGSDGTVYESAGSSVRTQFENVGQKLSEIDDAMQFDTVIQPAETAVGYYTILGEYGDNNGYRYKKYDASSLRNKTVYVSTYVYTNSLPLICFFDADMNKISCVTVPVGYYTNSPAVVPSNAVYATITTKIGMINDIHYSIDDAKLKIKNYVDVNQLNQNVNDLKPVENLNHWYGKKVVWLGTSVPFGSGSTKSYAKEVSDTLGFELVNASIPGQAIHTTANGGIVGSGSTCLSIEEYQNLGITIAESPISYTPGSNYNNYYRTYEHIFTQENADADLWVFDVFPNNTDFSLTDWNAFDRGQWKYSDNSAFSEHRNTFYGALLFLLDKLYQLNPNARVVFVIGSAFKLSDARTAVETLSTTALHYPYIDIWDRIGSNVKTNTYLYSNNGTDMHPSTKAHELMGRMLIGEFLSLA